MDEALFFSLQLEKFPGHEETMREFADANGIPFDLTLIYQLIEERRRDDERYAAEASLALQEDNDAECLGSWRSYINARLNHSAPVPDRHQALYAKPEHSDVLRQETPLMKAVVARRRAQGITQAEFARQLGVSVRTYQEWEQGRRQPSGPAESILRRALS
jgi:DNA-binding transcriptional regulator YiaG